MAQDVTGAAGGGTTDTLLINRASAPAPASVEHSGNLAQKAAGPGIRAGGSGSGGGSGDMGTLAIGDDKAAGDAAAAADPAEQQQQQQQHTAGLTDQIHRGSHTMHSGSTVGSDDPTATVRMKTPAAAGLSHRSGGSTGSIGEEATVCLRKPGSDEGGSAERQLNGGTAGDDTLVINRSARLRSALPGSAGPKDAAGTVAAAAAPAPAGKESGQAALLKPRRLGVLGKAQRVVPGSAGRPPLPPAAPADQQRSEAEAEGETAADANRKRKAEMEAAQSPKPLLSVAEGKRRQSPVEEVSAMLA